jgi:hypothetical protein
MLGHRPIPDILYFAYGLVLVVFMYNAGLAFPVRLTLSKLSSEPVCR